MVAKIRNPKNKKEALKIISILSRCFPQMKKTYFIKRILRDSSYDKSNTFILVRDNTIISHLQLFEKNICWGEKRARFLGLGFICTLPEYRNKGYAKQLLRYIVKEKGRYLLGLFTKIADCYREFGFEVVPRKRIIIKKRDFRNSSAPGIKIRRFNFGKDILPVMSIHKNYFSGQTGIINRPFEDWKNQLSYFDEEKRFFLVAESRGRIKAYIRCKLKEIDSKSNIEIVEYAFVNKSDGLISNFISYLFNKFNINEARGWYSFLKYALNNAADFEEEVDFKMMIRFNELYKRRVMDRYGLCFFESDGF